MIPVQHITCSPEQLSTLSEIYAGSHLHELRQRGHTIILRHKGYNLEEIASVLGKDKLGTAIIIKAFFHFGFEGLNNLDYEELLKRIREIEEPSAQPQKSDFWEWLNSVFRLLFRLLILIFFAHAIYSVGEVTSISNNAIYFLLPIFLLILIGWGVFRFTHTSRFQLIKPETAPMNSNENSLNFIGTGNTINQTNNQFVVNLNGENSEIKTLSEFIEAFKKSSESEEILKSNDSRILELNHVVKRFEGNPILKNLIIGLGCTIVYCSIKYGATIKGGFLIFSIFCVQFTATTLVDNEAIEIQKSNNKEKLFITKDTILSTTNLPNREGQLDFSKMLISDEHEYLIDVQNNKAKELIKKDSVDHLLELYSVNWRDDRAYLQVASYREIKFAAIQRKNLIENHHFNESDCKILYSNNFGEFLYGVTIGDAKRDDIEALSKIQNDWNLKAKSINVRAYLKTN